MQSPDHNNESNEVVRLDGEAHVDGQVEGQLYVDDFRRLELETGQNVETTTLDELVNNMDGRCQEALIEYLVNGTIDDAWLSDDFLSDAMQEMESSEHPPDTASLCSAPDDTTLAQATVVTMESSEPVARKRRATNDDDQPPSDGNEGPRPHVTRRVDDGVVKVEGFDVPFGNNFGKPTPGLRLLQALRLLQGRHKLQNEAELTFIKVILYETLIHHGDFGLSRMPALLKKWEAGNQGNAKSKTYQWDYECRHAQKTVLWMEASFKDVQKYFQDNPGKASFTDVWSEFVKLYGSDLTFPDTFISTMADIEEASSIDNFVQIYESGYFQRRLGLLEAEQGAFEGSIEEWCKQWALRLAQNNLGFIESMQAYDLNMTRKCALKLLYSMYDKCFPKNGQPTVSIADIAQHFGITRIIRILQTCLPMDRANALYNMKHSVKRKGGTPTNIQGMIWFAKKRDERIVKQWREDGDPRMNEATINKRLVRYFSVTEFGLQQYPELVEWMQPCRTPVSEIVDIPDSADNSTQDSGE